MVRASGGTLRTRRYIELVLKHRVAVMLIIGATTVAAAAVLPRGRMASSVIRLFFGDNPEYDAYRELADRFAENDVLVMAFEDDQLFTPKGWSRLEAIVAEIEQLADTRRVQSMVTANRVRGTEDELEVLPYGDSVPKTPEGYASLRQAVLDDELLQGVLVAGDACCSMVLIEMTADDDRPIEEVPAYLDAIHAAFTTRGIARERIHAAGAVVETVEATEVAQFNLERVLPFTSLILLVIVYLLFLRLWPVMITAGVAVISVLWAFALAILLDRDVNLLMAMVPAVMVVVSFSDIIHLCSSYLLEIQAGTEKREAIIKSGSEVGLACIFTSVTTMLGFVSLSFIPTPVFKHLGIVLGAGVAMALLLAVTLVPIFFWYMPVPQASRISTERGAAAVINAILNACRSLSSRYPRSVVLGFVALLVMSVIGITRINIETNMAKRLAEDNHIRVAQRFIQRHFAGTNFLDVYLSVDGDRDLLDPDVFAKIAQLQRRVEGVGQVESALSLVDLMKLIHREMGGEGDLPDSRALLSQYLLLFEMSGGEGLDRLIDEEHQTLRMSARLREANMVETSRVGNEIRRLGEETFADSVKVKPTGLTYLLGDWIKFITAGQRRGFLFALITTTLMMMLSLRLFGAGLISMIPNFLPVLVLGGYVGWAWPVVDSDTILIAMLGLGIAVDDTVHFMTRFRIEAQKTPDIDEAVRRTFHFTGRAIVQTTVILCLGFFPFAASDYFTTSLMGTLLPLTLVVALVADLLLLPALVRLRILRVPTA